LQTSIDELREEVSPLQEDNNRLFDEYQELKEDYDAILLQLTKKDETLHNLQNCKQNLEE
jgi:chromosome segregation ATPase